MIRKKADTISRAWRESQPEYEGQRRARSGVVGARVSARVARVACLRAFGRVQIV